MENPELHENIDLFLERVRDLIQKLPSAGSTTGLYNVNAATTHNIMVDVVPYVDGHYTTRLRTGFYVPQRFQAYESAYVDAAKKLLNEHKLYDRRDPASEAKIAQAAESGTEARIASALADIESKIPVPKTIPPSKTSFSGQFSVSIQGGSGTTGTSIVTKITPFKKGEWSDSEYLYSGVIKTDRPRAASYAASIRKLLEDDYSLTPTDQVLAPEHVIRLTHGIMEEAAKKFPSEFVHNGDGHHTKGIWNTSISLPSKTVKNANIQILVSLRPLDDYIARNERYILKPATFFINTNTRDEQTARTIARHVEEALNSAGFVNYDLSGAERENIGQKALPISWLSPEKMHLLQVTRGTFSIILTPAEGRKPEIKWSTGTKDPDQAEQILRLVRDQLLPQYMPGGIHETEALTLRKIAEYVQTHIQVQKTPAIPHRRDIRLVTAHDKERIRLFTPNLVFESGSYIANFSFGVPGSKTKTRRDFRHALNISDRELAEQYRDQLQTLIHQVLTHYFQQNKDVSIVTEMEPSNKEPQPVYRIATPGETPPPNQVFLRTLIDEQIKPALDQFNRYVYWESKVKKLPDDTYEILSSVRRNENNEALPDGISPFQGPLEFHAKDEVTARAFARQLDDEIIKEQYLFSRERPVDSFGQSSMGVVIRESLRTILANSPEIEPPHTHAFQTLAGRRLV